MSDLHLEFGKLVLKPIGEDVLILAGDIGVYTDGARWAARYARTYGVPVVMIAGNHEFYRDDWHYHHTIATTLHDIRRISPLTFLEDEIANICGITFAGSTLWTDFALNGDPVLGMRDAREAMNDYREIFWNETLRLTPELTVQKHQGSLKFLKEIQDSGKLVIITHHLPSSRSIAGRYADNAYNAAYASNLDTLVETSGAALWIHGHTHVSQDYCIGNTRVICNPRGYAGYEVNPNFNPDLIIEV
jgi:predicted phosphodiesterase